MPIKGVVIMQQLGTKTEMRLPPAHAIPRYGLAALDAAGKKPLILTLALGWISPLLVAVQR